MTSEKVIERMRKSIERGNKATKKDSRKDANYLEAAWFYYKIREAAALNDSDKVIALIYDCYLLGVARGMK